MRPIYQFDELVGEECGPIICCGISALDRSIGLNNPSYKIEAWSNLWFAKGLSTPFTIWYFNPLLPEHFGEDCTPSPVHKNILEPSKERALLEYMFYIEYFCEGPLLEALDTYALFYHKDYSRLYELAPKYRVTKEKLDYWIKEAEEEDMSMG